MIFYKKMKTFASKLSVFECAMYSHMAMKIVIQSKRINTKQSNFFCLLC